jgi:hypothetical protein
MDLVKYYTAIGNITTEHFDNSDQRQEPNVMTHDSMIHFLMKRNRSRDDLGQEPNGSVVRRSGPKRIKWDRFTSEWNQTEPFHIGVGPYGAVPRVELHFTILLSSLFVSSYMGYGGVV